MLYPKECLAKYGQPGKSNQNQYMIIWHVPLDIRLAFAHVKFSALGTTGFPEKIFCHKLMQSKLEKGLRNLIERGIAGQLQTWDGCYQIRTMRLSKSLSLHAYGCAIDVNAADNLQSHTGNITREFAQCFKDAGLDWGGEFKGKSIDLMHFQLKNLQD